jgi:hypothetical protein
MLFLHHEEQWRQILSLYNCQAYPGHDREHISFRG